MCTQKISFGTEEIFNKLMFHKFRRMKPWVKGEVRYEEFTPSRFLGTKKQGKVVHFSRVDFRSTVGDTSAA